MDLATLLGIVAAFGLVIGSIMSGDGAMTFLNVPALAIVVGGTLGAGFIAFPMKTVLGVLKIVSKAFLHKDTPNKELIGRLEGLARKARKEGLLGLEGSMDEIQDDLYRVGLQLVVDGQEADVIESILRTEVTYTAQRHQVGADLMKALGTFAPAFGMIGTIIGLIQMLQTMEDPSSIGPAMAVALVTTFYGALLANIVFIPLVIKLQRRSEAEMNQKNLIIEGLLSLHAGDNPRILVQKLQAFMPPNERDSES